MQNSDEAIDRVLTRLRNTEAPQGLNQRLHQSLDAGSNHRRQAVPRQSLRSLFPVRTLTFGAAAFAILVSTICWNVYRNSPSKVTQTTAHQQPPVSTPNPASTVAQATQPMQAPRPVTTIQQIAHSHSTKHSRLQAVSYPAPEAPLTDEERLLLRLAHGADPKTLEAYSPSQSAAHLAQQKADFQQFFDPPATVNNE